MNRTGLPSAKIVWTETAKKMSHIVDLVLHPMEEEDREKGSGEGEEKDSWDSLFSDLGCCPAETLLELARRGSGGGEESEDEAVAIVEAKEEEEENTGGKKEERKTLVCDLSPRSRRLATALREFAKGKSSSSSSSWVAHACMYNGADFLIPVLGTWLSGGVFSSGDPGLGAKVISGQIRTLVKSLASSVPVVFSSPGTAGKAEQAAKEAGQSPVVVVVGKALNEEEEKELEDVMKASEQIMTLDQFVDKYGGEDETQDQVETRDPDEICLVTWSSGTTGHPKGIAHTRRSITRAVRGTPLMPKGTFLQANCMFHAGGLVTVLRNCVSVVDRTSSSFSLSSPSSASPAQLCREAERRRATGIILGPHHAAKLMKYKNDKDLDLSSVRLVIPIGSQVPVGFEEAMSELFPNCVASQGYGMSELGHLTNGGGSGGVLGAPIRGVRIKVVDTETGEKLGPNELGEILCLSPSAFKGYLGDGGGGDSLFDSEGFFRTGDLGWYDRGGVLHYQDRIKDVIKVRNSHVSPREVEELIHECFPHVFECVAFGVPGMEDSQEESIAAVVVAAAADLSRGEHALKGHEVVEAAEKAAKGDSRLLLTGGVRVVSSGAGKGGQTRLPRTLTGKIRRSQVKGEAIWDMAQGRWP